MRTSIFICENDSEPESVLPVLGFENSTNSWLRWEPDSTFQAQMPPDFSLSPHCKRAGPLVTVAAAGPWILVNKRDITKWQKFWIWKVLRMAGSAFHAMKVHQLREMREIWNFINWFASLASLWLKGALYEMKKGTIALLVLYWIGFQ